MASSSSPPESNLFDLLVVLGTSRFGTDWPNVSASIKAALSPLDKAIDHEKKTPAADECQERFRALVEGQPSELTALAARLQEKRVNNLLAVRDTVTKRIKVLCEELPEGHAARPAAAWAAPPTDNTALAAAAKHIAADGGLEVAEDHEDATATTQGSGGNRGRGKKAHPTTDAELEAEIPENEQWGLVAEEENEKASKRATVAVSLQKMLGAISKHKWAYPFKRPVTDKEAPDYKEVIANPMDFATLKQRIVAGDVQEAALLVSDLNLIFDNAMVYNGKGTDYYRMAHTLKEIVRVQHANYVAKGGGKAVPAAEEAVKQEDEEMPDAAPEPEPEAAAAAAAPEPEPEKRGRGRRAAKK